MNQGAIRQILDQINRLSEAPQLPFCDLIEVDLVQDVLRAEKVAFRDRIYNPMVTLWTFLSQILSTDHSCREAVARLIAHRAARGQEPCSADTAG